MAHRGYSCQAAPPSAPTPAAPDSPGDDGGLHNAIVELVKLVHQDHLASLQSAPIKFLSHCPDHPSTTNTYPMMSQPAHLANVSVIEGLQELVLLDRPLHGLGVKQDPQHLQDRLLKAAAGPRHQRLRQGLCGQSDFVFVGARVSALIRVCVCVCVSLPVCGLVGAPSNRRSNSGTSPTNGVPQNAENQCHQAWCTYEVKPPLGFR